MRDPQNVFWPDGRTLGEFCWSDPLPPLAEAWWSLQSLARRGFRRVSRLERVRGKA